VKTKTKKDNRSKLDKQGVLEEIKGEGCAVLHPVVTTDQAYETRLADQRRNPGGKREKKKGFALKLAGGGGKNSGGHLPSPTGKKKRSEDPTRWGKN